jgi:predicted NBD/HSP70 family sugar kinase
LIKDISKYLAAGMVSLINIFNPQIIFLSGNVIEDIPELIPMRKRESGNMPCPITREDQNHTGILGKKAG